MRDFDKIIWRDALTYVDFFAMWCRPCLLMFPIVDKFQQQMKGRVDVYKIDIESAEDADIIQRYNILSVPTSLFFRHGEILWRGSGLMSFEQLRGVVVELEQQACIGVD
ncbi:MAG: thioredoxin family protein [Alistipes sp.]